MVLQETGAVEPFSQREEEVEASDLPEVSEVVGALLPPEHDARADPADTPAEVASAKTVLLSALNSDQVSTHANFALPPSVATWYLPVPEASDCFSCLSFAAFALCS